MKNNVKAPGKANHTATQLLHQGLAFEILGTHVEQKGSQYIFKILPFRFFTLFSKVTGLNKLIEVENFVNCPNRGELPLQEHSSSTHADKLLIKRRHALLAKIWRCGTLPSVFGKNL